MKYEYYPKRRTEQERRELNEQILRLLQSEACEQAGVTDEDSTRRPDTERLFFEFSVGQQGPLPFHREYPIQSRP